MNQKTHKVVVCLLFAFCLINQVSSSIVGDGGQSCCDQNVISVSGQGRVLVQPDIAIVSVGVSRTAKTSQQATRRVAERITQITQVLTRNNIRNDDIETQSISIFPQYEYPDGKMQLVGQTAQQFLEVTVRRIDRNGGNLGSLIDQLVAVDGIQFNGLRFEKDDKTEAERQARKLAFEDAKRKAAEYAQLADRNLGRVLTIVDVTVSSPTPVYKAADAFIARSPASTQVPVGEQEIGYSVSVRFALR